MATAKIETLLSLDRFAQLTGISPVHFNQVALPGLETCGQVWFQYDWQKQESTSREEVARAVRSAEDSLEEYLGFSVLPKWYADVKLTLPRGDGAHVSGRVTVPRSEYIMGGIRKQTLIEADAAIVYSSTNLYVGYDDLATITIAQPAGVTDPEEIALYYPSQDGSEGWRIKPIKVTIAGNVITVTCARHQLVLWDRLEEYIPAAVDGTDDTKFLATADVYRVYNDPSVQGIFQLANGCCGTGCAQCTILEQTSCIRGYSIKPGIIDIIPATWDADTLAYTQVPLACCGTPFAARLWWRGGWRAANSFTNMDVMWEMAVARLALSRLEKPLCPCPGVQQKLHYWTEDLGESKSQGTTSSTHQIPPYLRDCPWGYQRGALYAFSLAIKHRSPQGC